MEHIHVAISDGGEELDPTSLATFAFDNRQALEHVDYLIGNAIEVHAQVQDTADSYAEFEEARSWRTHLGDIMGEVEADLQDPYNKHARKPVKEHDVLKWDGVGLDRGAYLLAQGCVDEDCLEVEPDDAPDDPPEHKKLDAEGR